MAESDKNIGRFSRQRSEDLRYADEGTSGVPLFSTWTQFSGMPTHNSSEIGSTFPWESFGPQGGTFSPSTLNADPAPDFMHCQKLLSHSRSSPTVLEPDPRPADNSVTSGISFNDASQEGKDAYAEAMQNWSSFSPTYDPFGSTSDVIGKTILSKPQEIPGQSSSNTKPSYSDIAKTLKSKPIQTKDREREETESIKKKLPEPITRPFRANVKKHYVTRQNSKGHGGSPDDMESKVMPDSKYGLDQFEEVVPTEGERLKSNSVESIPLLTRKGSTSSVSSGTSGIEEIHLSGKNTTSRKDDPSSGNRKADVPKSGTPKNSNKAFFDPRRIFQSKNNRKSTNEKLIDPVDNSTVLNNGKPANSSKSSTLTSDHKRTTDYINNDLSDSKKKTNTVNNTNEKCENVVKNGKVDKKGKQGGTTMTKSNTGSGTGNSRNGGRHRGFLPLQSTFDQEYVDEWLGYIFEKVRHGVSSLWSLIFTVIILAFGLIAYLVSGCVYIVNWIWSRTYVFIKTRIFKSKYFAGRLGDSGAKRKIGLDENIALPSTGDEAMQRLLACKGKDPYSILGLRSDATDDDIRKYYRKQAVLVHPDKNKQPGAEEAFKILGHAFELIGESEKRRLYDTRLQEADKAEAAMKEFNDLLTKLKEKIQEAGNLMRCDNCGGKHKRIPVDRPFYSARFCKRCNIRHSAKEGDVWAETSMLGFLWHYYACMEGKIYDITEWVACKKDFFKHMQPSAHHVFYRIATEGSRDKGHQSRSGEAELEDFINHLFHQAMHQEGNTSGNQWQQSASSTSTNQNYSSTSSNTTTQGNKKARRRKKKH